MHAQIKSLKILLCLLFCFSQQIASAQQASNQSDRKCRPEFPLKEGWLGGDGIFSVPLNSGKTIWLFGDSFVSSQANSRTEPLNRLGAEMVANTLALSKCGPQGFELNYYWHKNSSPPQKPFFQGEGFKYWPIHGFEYAGKLYLALERIQTTDAVENGFNFEITGVDLAVVSNPESPPPEWQITIKNLSENREIIPGIAMVREKGYLYLLSFQETPQKNHPFLLNRIPISSLQQTPLPLEYLSQSKIWKQGLTGPDAQVLIPNGATEASLFYDPETKMWMIVHTSPEFLHSEIVIYQARELIGPWINKQVFTNFYPEMDKTQPLYDTESFCYAAKAHPQFSNFKAHELLIGYACNSFHFNKLLQSTQLYRPQVKNIKLNPEHESFEHEAKR